MPQFTPAPNGYFDFANTLLASRGNHAKLTRLQVTAADSFLAQWTPITDDYPAQVWDCSRRAAKTTGAIIRTVKRSDERPGWRTLYIHRTRELAKKQFFETEDKENPGVVEMLEAKRIPVAKVDRMGLSLRLANNSYVEAVGCDDIKSVNKKLGFKWNDIIIDECQDQRDDILQRLVKKTILPTLIDRGGSLTLLGTPAEVETGLWYEAKTAHLRPPDPDVPIRWRRHHWTLLDNPFIDRQKIIDAMGIAGFKIDFEDWTNNDIIVQREIFGLQVIDPSKLVYCYNPARNNFPGGFAPLWLGGARPDLAKGDWRFAMGIDIGGASEDNDSDAVVVLGWDMEDGEHRIWECEAWTGHGDSEDFTVNVMGIYDRFSPMMSVCGDTGGAGAVKALATLSKRMGGMLLTPKPTSVELSTRLVNDDFRSGRFKVLGDGVIATGAKSCLKGRHEPDIMAAARYAHHGAYHFLAEASKVETDPDKLDEQRFVQRELDRRRFEADPYSPFRD